MGAHTPKEIKAAIMARIEEGHPISALAAEYQVTATTIYGWVKAKQGKGLHLVPDEKMPPDEQIEMMAKEFTTRIKSVLIKQIQDNIRNMNL